MKATIYSLFLTFENGNFLIGNIRSVSVLPIIAVVGLKIVSPGLYGVSELRAWEDI